MAKDNGGSGLGTVLLSATIGAAVGAAVALLFAPKPGTELRTELGEKAKEAGEKVREAATRARERLDEMCVCEDGDDAEELVAEAEAPEAGTGVGEPS